MEWTVHDLGIPSSAVYGKCTKFTALWITNYAAFKVLHKHLLLKLNPKLTIYTYTEYSTSKILCSQTDKKRYVGINIPQPFIYHTTAKIRMTVYILKWTIKRLLSTHSQDMTCRYFHTRSITTLQQTHRKLIVHTFLLKKPTKLLWADRKGFLAVRLHM